MMRHDARQSALRIDAERKPSASADRQLPMQLPPSDFPRNVSLLTEFAVRVGTLGTNATDAINPGKLMILAVGGSAYIKGNSAANARRHAE